MEAVDDDDDDLKLVKASAALLADVQVALPKVLWKPPKNGSARGSVHSRVRQRDLDYIVNLIEPFQGEPQLLDARLKDILPPIVDAYLQYVQSGPAHESGDNITFETAVCTLLYTICKVRGYKIVLQFLSNEPRYLEPILLRLETVHSRNETMSPNWQVSYTLLLWLSHLILTPFDLASFSGPGAPNDALIDSLKLLTPLPSIGERVLLLGLQYLHVSTKAQDAAALLLVRLVTRPDMRKFLVGDAVVLRILHTLQAHLDDKSMTIYEQIGSLRLLAGIVSAPELSHLLPRIYQTCNQLAENESSALLANAVAKKLVVKIFRNVAILSLRPLPAHSSVQQFGGNVGVLENVIDYCLGSLGDRDTPVRYAAAKALSLIILQLEPEMGHEIIQAILDTFQEDMRRFDSVSDFRDANALTWHGLTLALAHTLFKRSASPNQLADIVRVLVFALQFEQRTATGSSVGTNVRDAANFGIWALSRRYTTQELSSVSVLGLPGLDMSQDSKTVSQYLSAHGRDSVIQYLAVQLILSACLDPAGNIRRGSSAALQELIGRHPNEVQDGIAVVQIVDYQAVGLRGRAMRDVAYRAAELHLTYWTFLVEALFGWRGLNAPDVFSRDAAAASLARLSLLMEGRNIVLRKLLGRVHATNADDCDSLQGLVLALAHISEGGNLSTTKSDRVFSNHEDAVLNPSETCKLLDKLTDTTRDFSLRLLRSELPAATVRLLATLSVYLVGTGSPEMAYPWIRANEQIEVLTQRMLTRYEDTTLQVIPSLVVPLMTYRHLMKLPLGCLEVGELCKQVRVDSTKATLHGAGRAIALGRLSPCYNHGTSLSGRDTANAIVAVGELMNAGNIDWRIIAVKAMQLAVQGSMVKCTSIEPLVLEHIVNTTHRAMSDYTIDERGDIGSLVRLQGIRCASTLFATPRQDWTHERHALLQADIHRLSLEKLDRVRLAAATCMHEHLDLGIELTDVASVSTYAYFKAILRPLCHGDITLEHRALLEGVISCAGVAAEPILQASRAALVHLCEQMDSSRLHEIFSVFASVLKSLLTNDTNNVHAALELLGFLLDMQIPQRLAHRHEFKWRNLLSTVQKSHHKSNDIPKILAAVHVYGGLADIPSIRPEVMKKLIGMLKTNPYPRVRLRVAETLFMITKASSLKEADWLKPAIQNVETIMSMENEFVIKAITANDSM